MSAAEKALNKNDLYAYKAGEGKNYAMIPGIQLSNQLNGQRSPTKTGGVSADGLASPKRLKEAAEKVIQNNDRFQQQGAIHLGKGIANYEQKNYLGSGNLLNGGYGQNSNRQASPAEKAKKGDTLYSGPAGSSLGPGRQLHDGTLDRNLLDGGNQMSPP